MITADHGCDPSTPSTDHSREYTPLVIAGDPILAGTNLGTRPTFADIGTTICDYLGVPQQLDGTSFLKISSNNVNITKNIFFRETDSRKICLFFTAIFVTYYL